ncbi:hypothetical protein [Endozoicomonas sp. Mp262]
MPITAEMIRETLDIFLFLAAELTILFLVIVSMAIASGFIYSLIF